jgi:flavin-dependent dehydrogenase
VILAGDAAGLVDPLTGEGIAYAIESGALAAQAVADWLAAGEAGDLTGRYVAGLAGIHASLTASNRLAASMHNRFVPAALKRHLVAQERVQRKFFAILGGAAESTDLAKFNLARFLLLKR